MESLGLHPCKLWLRLLCVEFANPQALWMPIRLFREPTEPFEFSGMQLASNLTFPHLNLGLWFNLFQGIWQSEWSPLLAWSLLHKFGHTSGQISSENVARRCMERAQCNHEDTGISFPKTPVFTFFCIHFCCLPGFIWQSLGRITFGYVYKMLSV